MTRPVGNGGPYGETDVEVFPISQPVVKKHPPLLPHPSVTEKTLFPPAIAHLRVSGDSPNLSTKTGGIQTPGRTEAVRHRY